MTKDDGREQLPHVMLAQEVAFKTEQEHIPQVRQFLSVICKTIYPHDKLEVDDWEQYGLFK